MADSLPPARATQAIEIVAFDPIEIILGLRVHHAEYGVCVGLP